MCVIYGECAVRRWTKSIDLLKYDKLFFPIHCGGDHWSLAVICMSRGEISHYDSLNRNGTIYLNALKQWIYDVFNDKHHKIPHSSWQLLQCKDCPQQNNGCDCGVFTLLCCSFLSEGMPLNYHQQQIPVYRKLIAFSVLRGSLP